MAMKSSYNTPRGTIKRNCCIRAAYDAPRFLIDGIPAADSRASASTRRRVASAALMRACGSSIKEISCRTQSTSSYASRISPSSAVWKAGQSLSIAAAFNRAISILFVSARQSFTWLGATGTTMMSTLRWQFSSTYFCHGRGRLTMTRSRSRPSHSLALRPSAKTSNSACLRSCKTWRMIGARNRCSST